MRTRSILLALPLLAGSLGPAAAQDPARDGHGHAPRSGGGGVATPAEEEDEEKGPNLQIPAWIGGAKKARYEAAIASWEEAFAKAEEQGFRAARRDVAAAMDELRALKELGRDCALPDYYLGIGHQVLGNYEEAQERLERAIDLNPRFHEAMVELGDAHRWEGDEREAARAYDDAVETRPDYAHAYRRRAVQRVKLQELEDARADVRRGLELEPDDARLKLLERKLDLVLDGPDWETTYEEETDDYIVRTNVSQAFCEKIAKHAELIRRLYETLFPRNRNRRKSPIVVFESKKEYHRNGGPENAGGHFDPIFKQLFLFQYPEESDTLLVLYHEGFHQFLDGVLDVKPPQWLNEGLADFFGPSEYYRTRGDEGMRIRPNPWRFRLVKKMIRAGKWTRFERLMTMSQAEMYGKGVSLHYAQAWSIVYFLVRADDGAHFEYLKDYFNALRDGEDREEAFEEAFGGVDLEAMEERWQEYMLDLKESG